ncbi:LOW QUALITY PROTEIN: hypothetical protein Cgig2_016842 [Carnegiea gigantea]|uniref:Reverse transcriptase zinc-binding domain-containing protein n=1 Tax=Carnegiea gigantea TaxID=171969 RepID=A0A9Q1JIF5_9CARY|nr:LOW QUALITY PROTEIN: hypothetical protein Cgig2_016842 [Carnegiea gigantea]
MGHGHEERHFMGQTGAWEIFETAGLITKLHQSTAVWARIVTPRHASTTWFFMHQKLPVKCRMARFTTQGIKLKCELCGEAEEDMNHLFFKCKWAREYWQVIHRWLSSSIDTNSMDIFLHSIRKLKGSRGMRMIAYAIIAAVIYQIWRIRNEKIISHHQLPVQTQCKHTKDHII